MARFVSTKGAGGTSSSGGSDGNDFMWKRIHHCAKWTQDYGNNYSLALPTCDYQAFRYMANGFRICQSQHMCHCWGFGYNNGTYQGNNNKFYGWCNWCWPSRSCCCWNAFAEGDFCMWSHQASSGEGAGIVDLCIFQWGHCSYNSGSPCQLCQVGFDLKWRATECCGWKRKWGYSYDWLAAMDWIPSGASHNPNYCNCTFDTLCMCAPQSWAPACGTSQQSGTAAFKANWALYGIPWGHVHSSDTSTSS